MSFLFLIFPIFSHQTSISPSQIQPLAQNASQTLISILDGCTSNRNFTCLDLIFHPDFKIGGSSPNSNLDLKYHRLFWINRLMFDSLYYEYRLIFGEINEAGDLEMLICQKSDHQVKYIFYKAKQMIPWGKSIRILSARFVE
ncbi:unnamed protein product [Caenorhabditis angaria]|uniref:Nuclear transport factor 2 family protein n=1 Tax=Caenorhabditis angaria TaxID=860376 RepID=A0A9P1ID64_9PELO|nr:unnamed protein product [Caenorhabditis angaria]